MSSSEYFFRRYSSLCLTKRPSALEPGLQIGTVTYVLGVAKSEDEKEIFGSSTLPQSPKYNPNPQLTSPFSWNVSEFHTLKQFDIVLRL